MPSGRVHATMSTLAALGLYWLGNHMGRPDAVAQALAGGCAAGIVIYSSTPSLFHTDSPSRISSAFRCG
ncbi:MAG: hypothetical protein AB1512_27130 [Thermodesulfobacteriota bacterium]